MGTKGFRQEIYSEAHADKRVSRVEPFWTVGQDEAARLASELNGLDLTGRIRRTSTQFMRHGEKRHGVDGEAIIDQMPLTAADFAKIPDVIANHDLAYFGKVVNGQPRIVYQKRVNGHIFYVEEIAEGNHLDSVSVWKQKAGGQKGASGSFDQVGSGTLEGTAKPTFTGKLSIAQGSSGVNSPHSTATQSSTPREPGNGADGSSKPLSGAILLGSGLAADRQTRASGGNDRGGLLLARAVAVRGSLKHDTYVDRDGKKRTAKWYVVGATPQARGEREAMAAHLLRRRPDLAGRTWFLPGVGSGTLPDLVVERGVVPAEVGNLYRQDGQQWRSGGGQAGNVGRKNPMAAGGYR